GSFSRADSPEDLARVYDQLGLELAHEYLVGYNSIVKPGRPVNVAVKVKGLGAASAGYVTPVLAPAGGVYHRSQLDRVWQSALAMILIALLIPSLLAAAIVVPLVK